MIAGPSICIVGRGRLGRALAEALPGAVAVAARADDRALDEAIAKVAAPARTYVFAVADDHLAAVADRVASRSIGPGDEDVALHTSGAATADAAGPLRAFAASGVAVGSLHVLRSVSRGVAEDLAGAAATVAGDESARARARAIAQEVGLYAFEAPAGGDARVLYHAAAALVAGGGIALVDAALSLWEAAGIDRGRARPALAELLASSARNLAESAPAAALTGPFARGDAATVAAHVGALAAVGASERELYAAVARRLVELRSGELPAAVAARLRALVQDAARYGGPPGA